MPLPIYDAALTLQNLKLEYFNSLVLSFEGHTFKASPELILWIERQLTFRAKNEQRAYDLDGLPVQVTDLKGLLKALTDKLSEADSKYLTAWPQVNAQFVGAFADLPDTKEHEE